MHNDYTDDDDDDTISWCKTRHYENAKLTVFVDV